MSVAQAAIMCVESPSSCRVLIRQVAAGPRIWPPSMMKPPPLSSASFPNETLAPLFTNTLLQTLASVVHAPARSAAPAGAPSDAEPSDAEPSETHNENAEKRIIVIDLLPKSPQ